MRSLRIAAATLNQTPLDWKGNTSRILQAIHDASSQGVHLLCLPELCVTGYGCEDMFLAPETTQKAHEILHKISQVCPADLTVALGLPTIHHGRLYNTVAVINNQKVKAFHAKSHLAGDGIHYEPRWFKAWKPGTHDHTSQHIPIGDLMLLWKNQEKDTELRIGFEICEDAWVSNRPGNRLAQSGVDIILNPSASHFSFGKIETRKRFVLEGSRAFHCVYAYANLNGNEAGRAIYDGGALLAANGELLAQGPRFHQEDTQITIADYSINLLQSRQIASASRDPFDGNTIKEVEIHLPSTQTPKTNTPHKIEAWETSPYLKEEEFTRAMTIALRDYRRKSHTNGYVISLSGGADSAAVACLAYYEAKLEGKSAEMPQRVSTIYQASDNSSDTTKNAAAQLAGALNTTHHEVDISPLIDSYLQIFSKTQGKTLDWKNAQDDITLQNIQARARGPMAWLLANDEGKLLLATSNRSEAAVGYATMDGDTCGSLSPIGGIDKTFLLQWLNWAEKIGPEGLGPIPALNAITKQKPTAELRPTEKSQTDEADLMPYPVLGEIENLLIRDKLNPAETINTLIEKFPQYSAGNLAVWVEKFKTLWKRNQWKRERYAPAFHVDDKNLDPRSWLRYPLLSGE